MRALGRREFLHGLTGVSTAALFGTRPAPVAAEPPPETTRLRLVEVPATCVAPQYVAEDLLHTEGFADVQYLTAPFPAKRIASGDFDIVMSFITNQVALIDLGAPVVIIAGGHVGCTVLFAKPSIHSLRDLRGKVVAVRWIDALAPEYSFIASFAASVGLDPRRDLKVVEHPWATYPRLLSEGKIDAFAVGPPQAVEFAAKKVGRVLIDIGQDRPWSQYFCCMVAGNREFTRRNPVATKRTLRAILKANQLCALEPERVAQSMVDRGYSWATRESYAHVLQGLKELPYGRWREYDSEDTVRFYALRLHEAGMIKSSPQKILAQGTDWRFLNELKKELKG